MLVSSGCAYVMLLAYYGREGQPKKYAELLLLWVLEQNPCTLPLILCNLSEYPSVLVLYSVWWMTTSCLNSRVFNPWGEQRRETEN